MICPNCHKVDLEIYDYEDIHNGEELKQKQNLWCPNCQYHCLHNVWYKEIDRQMVWEERE